MTNKKYLAIALTLCLTIGGCSVLSSISAWLPFGISVLDGVVAIAAPLNTTIAADANSGQTIFNDLDAAVAAAAVAGAGKTGLAKVISEISSAVASQQKLLADLGAVGLSLNAKDLSFVTASENLLIAALRGFQTQLAASSGTPAPAAAAISGDCFGFEPVGKNGGPHVWANCDPSDPIDFSWDRDPQTGKVVPAPSAKVANVKLGSFKRQYNALCKKYGRSEKQLHLTVAEHLRLK
jgi:hypothetical protein